MNSLLNDWYKTYRDTHHRSGEQLSVGHWSVPEWSCCAAVPDGRAAV